MANDAKTFTSTFGPNEHIQNALLQREEVTTTQEILKVINAQKQDINMRNQNMIQIKEESSQTS